MSVYDSYRKSFSTCTGIIFNCSFVYIIVTYFVHYALHLLRFI